MNFKKEHRHIIDFLFVTALLFLFAFSTLMLIALGASVYRRNVDQMEANYETRTSFAYITEKIRQADSSGSLSTGSIENIPALLITQENDGISYTTYLYEYNGNLTELLARTDLQLSPQSGRKITPLKSFDILKVNDHLYRIIMEEPDKEKLSLYLSVRENMQEGAGHS
ncbi:MAG: DUF4860 domain-containing protein [Butyrivibrio sp.]|jgi:hypothetical protein|nr:DUF4860 domain-containing protein [Butyrivibrio sp.]